MRIPNPGKVLFPDDGITKEDLARYYADGQFTISTVRTRPEGADDPWHGFTRSRHGLGQASARLAALA